MTGKTIYLVERITGNYSDRLVEIVKAFDTSEKAVEYIEAKDIEFFNIYEISEAWNKRWDPEISCKELSLDNFEDFFEFLVLYFPDDVEVFGKEKLKQAFELYERGILYDCGNSTYRTIPIKVE